MELLEIDSLLQEKRLKNPILSALKIDATLYHTLIFQPKAEILATPNSINSSTTSNMFAKCRNFINLAKSKNVDLAIMPEYACPKELINEIITNNEFPQEGKLWILGCQSLTKNELRNIVAQNSAEWLFESDIFNKPGNFLNPVFYFFRTKDNDDSIKNVAIIQFKTTPMANTIERDNMICGSKIYILRNNVDSTHLLTYICSDTLEFRDSDFTEGTGRLHTPFLIIHIQLNENPRHDDIQRHRQFFFRSSADNRELICLNWAKQTKINSNVISFGGTALYTKSAQLDCTNQRIGNNHKNGLYYTFWGPKYTHTYYFNSDEATYYLKNTKVSQISAAAPTVNRTGPEILETYAWDTSNDQWILIEPSDGVKDFCLQNGYNLPVLTNNSLNPVDKERLVALSCGRVEKKHTNWHDVKELEFFKVANDEIIKRITYVQDPHALAQQHRIDIYERFSALINRILIDSTKFPKCIYDLFNNSQIGYAPQNGMCNYDCNLIPISTTGDHSSATVAYIGSAPSTHAKKIYDRISELIGGDKSRRLVIWYEETSNICSICDTSTPTVSTVFTPGNSITKDN
ncbi:MAG: hypothetical protein WC980_07895 [Candidatus Brocadiia bacterium]